MRFRRHREAAEAATAGMLLGFAAAVLALVLAVNGGLALLLRLAAPVAGGYPPLFFLTNTCVVLLFVLGGCWIETLRLREGGPHVARLAGGRPLGGSGQALERRLANVVQEMAIAARRPAPAVWVLPRDQTINAFAAGWTDADAVIAVTQGALERLTRAELQGLVGHELAHIGSGDTRLHTRLIGLVWGLQLVHDFGLALIAPDDQGRRPASAPIGLVFVVLGYAGWLAGRLLQSAVARQREFHADAAAVEYARTVDGIGGVLRKIAGLPALEAPRALQSLAHLWIAAPSGPGWRGWLATHPPIAERLRRLYGRPVERLPAPLLPPPAEADEPMLAMAMPAQPPRGASAGAWPQAPSPHSRAAPARPPGAAVDAQGERDAIARAAFWRSRGESQAALLAWLIADDGAQAPWALWQATAGDQPYVARLRADWLTLGAQARWQVFDALVARVRGAPAADRAALLATARRLAPQGAARLRRALLARELRRPRAPRQGGATLETLAPAFAAASGLMARTLGPAASHWAAALGAAVSAAPAQAAALRRLHAMQRPRVARAWADSARQSGLLDAHPAASCLLVVACRLLDTPVPRSLQKGDQPRIL